MKTILFVLIALGAILIISCEKENTVVTVPLSAQSVDIPDSAAFGQECNYTIHSTLPNSCYWFYRLAQSSQINEIDITVFARYDTKDVCLQVAGPIDIPGHFSFMERGTYFIHFWRTDSTSLDKTLTVY
jgi:hypothetical protein